MRPRTTTYIYILSLLLLLLPTAALAGDVEIITYGGFQQVSDAYKRVALLTSGTGYKSIFAGLGIFGFIAAGIGAIRAGTAGRSSFLSAFVPPIAGIIVFVTLIMPKDNVSIYDETLNRTITIAQVPTGVARAAWFSNQIERAIIQALDSSSVAFTAAGSGVSTVEPSYASVGVSGFEALSALMNSPIKDSIFASNLSRYIQDCLMFEMNRPGTIIPMNALFDPPAGMDLISILAEAQNPAIYSVMQLPSGGASPDSSVTCAQAWTTYIQPKIASGTLTREGLVAAAGLVGAGDTTNTRNLIDSAFAPLATLSNWSNDAERLAGNAAVANLASQVLTNGDPAAVQQFMTAKDQAAQGLKSGIVTSFVNPRMINAYLAYAISMSPILLLFVASPLCMRVAALIIGLFAWVATARIVDVLAYHMWMSEFLQAGGGLNNLSGGVMIPFDFTSFLDSHISSFGSIRSSGFLLATAISSMLWKFSDSTLAHIGSGVVRAAEGGVNAVKPGESEKAVRDLHADTQRGAAIRALATSQGWSNMGKGIAAGESASAMSGLGKLDAAGGDYSKLAGAERHSSGVNSAEQFGKAEQLDMQTARITGAASAVARAVGSTDNGTAVNREQNRQTGQTTSKIGDASLIFGSNGQLVSATGTGADVMAQGAAQSSVIKALSNANQNHQALIKSGIESLSYDVSTGTTDSTRVATGAAFSSDTSTQSTVRKAQRQALASIDSDRDSYTDSRGQRASNEVFAEIKQGLPPMVKAFTGTDGSVGYRASYQTHSGQTYDRVLNAEQSRRYEQNMDREMATIIGNRGGTTYNDEDSHNIQRAITSRSGQTWQSQLQESAQRVQSLTNTAQELNSAGSQAVVKAGEGFLKHFARQLYGSDDQQALENTTARMMEMRQTPEGARQLQQAATDYGRNVYQPLATPADIQAPPPPPPELANTSTTLEGLRERLKALEASQPQPNPINVDAVRAKAHEIPKPNVDGNENLVNPADLQANRADIRQTGGNIGGNAVVAGAKRLISPESTTPAALREGGSGPGSTPATAAAQPARTGSSPAPAPAAQPQAQAAPAAQPQQQPQAQAAAAQPQPARTGAAPAQQQPQAPAQAAAGTHTQISSAVRVKAPAAPAQAPQAAQAAPQQQTAAQTPNPAGKARTAPQQQSAPRPTGRK